MRYKVIPIAGLVFALAVGLISGLQADEFTAEDLKKWQGAFMDVVWEGEKLFHSALGSNTVSCDMCHPNGTNCHPETYPKYQKQLSKVATLRDMINWCIENPVRGPRLDADDARMRALEGYILAQRSGTVMSYGKH